MHPDTIPSNECALCANETSILVWVHNCGETKTSPKVCDTCAEATIRTRGCCPYCRETISSFMNSAGVVVCVRHEPDRSDPQGLIQDYLIEPQPPEFVADNTAELMEPMEPEEPMEPIENYHDAIPHEEFEVAIRNMNMFRDIDFGEFLLNDNPTPESRMRTVGTLRTAIGLGDRFTGENFSGEQISAQSLEWLQGYNADVYELITRSNALFFLHRSIETMETRIVDRTISFVDRMIDLNQLDVLKRHFDCELHQMSSTVLGL